MQPIQDVFAQINDRINEEMAAHPEYAMMWRFKSKYPIGELF
jgi:amidophosphoribosyltransferase